LVVEPFLLVQEEQSLHGSVTVERRDEVILGYLGVGGRPMRTRTGPLQHAGRLEARRHCVRGSGRRVATPFTHRRGEGP
jgi:hypothetical protein